MKSVHFKCIFLLVIYGKMFLQILLLNISEDEPCIYLISDASTLGLCDYMQEEHCFNHVMNCIQE